MLSAYPLPTPGFRQGTNNAHHQRATIRRTSARTTSGSTTASTTTTQFTYRYGKYSWKAVDAFGGTFPYARSDWNRPNPTQTASWTSTLSSKLVNEFSYTNALDEVFINVFRGTDLYQRSKYGINYPYIFPQNKEIPDKIPTITIDTFTELNGGPYPASSRGPIYTFYNATTWLKGRHTIKAGVSVEYSGQDDFDQINVQPIPGSTNNQNGRFQFTNASAGATHRAPASPTPRSACSPTTRRSASGRSPSSGRSAPTCSCRTRGGPASNLTIEGGVRWVLLAAVVFDQQQHRHVRSGGLQHDQPGDRRPGERPDHGGPALQRRRAAGRWLH